jgi:hypothetical protein
MSWISCGSVCFLFFFSFFVENMFGDREKSCTAAGVARSPSTRVQTSCRNRRQRVRTSTGYQLHRSFATTVPLRSLLPTRFFFPPPSTSKLTDPKQNSSLAERLRPPPFPREQALPTPRGRLLPECPPAATGRRRCSRPRQQRRRLGWGGRGT